MESLPVDDDYDDDALNQNSRYLSGMLRLGYL